MQVRVLGESTRGAPELLSDPPLCHRVWHGCSFDLGYVLSSVATCLASHGLVVACNAMSWPRAEENAWGVCERSQAQSGAGGKIYALVPAVRTASAVARSRSSFRAPHSSSRSTTPIAACTTKSHTTKSPNLELQPFLFETSWALTTSGPGVARSNVPGLLLRANDLSMKPSHACAFAHFHWCWNIGAIRVACCS